jgi:hypothetical protein
MRNKNYFAQICCGRRHPCRLKFINFDKKKIIITPCPLRKKWSKIIRGITPNPLAAGILKIKLKTKKGGDWAVSSLRPLYKQPLYIL